MRAFPAVVSPCIDQAMALAPRMLARAIDAAELSLLEESRRSRSDDREALAAAAGELPQRRSAWCSAVAASWRDAMESTPTAGGGPRVSPSSLTLVDDSEVTQSIEAARLAMQLESLLEKPLADLDRYFSSALGVDGIQRDANPLRPAVFAQAVRQLMKGGDVPSGRPAIWMRPMAEPFAAELKELYETAAATLARAGVKAAEYRVVTVPGALGPKVSQPGRLPDVRPIRPAPQERPRASMSGWIELATQAVGGAALRDFLFGSAPQVQQPLAPAYYRQVDEELAALEARWDEAPPDPEQARAHQHLPAVDRPVRAVGTQTALSHETWGRFGAPRQRSLVRTQLRKQAERVGQAMGIDLVHQLVDQVAQDPRLLAPVREAIVALEPSLARLAMHSPQFFGKQEDPARRMLEAVAQRSFKYNDEFSTEFQEFFSGVTKRFNALNGTESLADATPFADALRELESDWKGQDDAEANDREKVLAAIRFAEDRQSQADRIASELAQRPDLEGAPVVVQDFLFKTWALVIAHARLQSGGADMDPGGYIRVVADLLWSVKRETTLHDPARAFELIPRLLPTLRAGLDQLGHPRGETDSFFQALERLHRPVLKLRAKHRHQSLAADLGAAPLEDDLLPAPAQKPAEHDGTWMRDGEMRACGFEDTLPSDFAGLDALPAQDAGADASEARVQAVIAGLAEGAWVDLYSKRRWRRAQLTWAAEKGTLFMFVSHGGRPHSMTRRSLERLIASRLLRPVDSHQVVQRALETLVRPREQALAA